MMGLDRATVALLFVTVYLGSCIGIGIWAMRRTRDSHDFFMAGRNLGVVLTAFAAFSSTLSGFGFVGGPGLVYSMGSSSIWMVATAISGGFAGFLLVAKKIRLLAEVRGSISLPDVMAARYSSNAVRAWTAVVVILGVLGYLATQILAMSIVLRDLLTDAGYLPGMSLELAVLISTGLLVFYTVTGGIIATVYTDFVQGVIMMVAGVLVFITAVNVLPGGIAEITTVAAMDDPGSVGAFGTLGAAGAISWFLIFAIGGSGQPHVITKFMMLRSVKDLRRVIPLVMLAYCLAALLWIGIGMAMRAAVLAGVHPPLASADGAAPAFLQAFAHPALAGIVFAALLAAIMSTADGFLNIGTAAIVHDIPVAIFGRSVPNELFWARVVTVVLAAIAALFALYTGDLVAILGAFGWGTFAAALVPTVAIGLNWKRANATAALAAIISSLVFNFGIKITGTAMPWRIDVGTASFIVSMTLFLGLSWFMPQKPLPPDVDAVMDL
jgi:SSS family transporter